MTLFPDATGRPPRVLIVDDERQNRQLLEVMLAAEGFLLTSAASGEEALALVEQERPDLILLDIMMPGMDGYEVTRRIKGNPGTESIPIIMITAIDDRRAMLLGLTAGAEDFLTKPVDRAELKMRVRNLLRLKAFGDYHDKYSKRLESEAGLCAADLVESEARFRQLAESIDEVFFLVNPLLTEMLYVSPAYENIFGRSCASLYADPLSWTYPIPPGERERVLGEIMPYGTLVPFDIEYAIVRPDGAGRVVRARGFPIANEAREVYRFAGIAEDVTERRRLDAQLRQASKMDAVGQLASGIAHDFNNLLSVILSYSDLLSADLNESDPMRADLKEIEGAGLRAVALTRQLLAFSRQQVLQPRVVNLSEIVQGLENMLRRLIGEDVELVVSSHTRIGRIVVDSGQIEQVIVNLAVNARDAMPKGGKLTIETSEVFLEEAYVLEHVGVKSGPHVMLAVTDSGMGMDKATQARMFEPFFTTKEIGKGTGLGLATVFGIVQQSEGAISVCSELGTGTTFRLYFPMDHAEPTARISVSLPANDSLRGSEKILVVEDDERVRTLACTILRKYGYHALEAQSGGDAFLLCEQDEATIHLLLTDMVMPRMSGRELAKRLLIVRPQMRVLYMSGYTSDAALRQSTHDSTIAFLQKPITPEALARKVRETLDAAGPV
jgi:PAS domain S-box-containing protein